VLAAAALVLAAATSTVATSRGDQTLRVYAPSAPPAQAAERPLVLVLSGEGGWRAFDEQLATSFSRAGYWVGGVDCLKYFWKPQDDREALSSDVTRFASALTRAAGAKADARIVLAGFSFGADLAPWIAGAKGRSAHIAALVMIGPDPRGSLEVRVTEILGFAPKSHTFDTAAALADARSIPVLFIHGGKDDDSAAPALAAGFTGPKALAVVPGATHHFGGHEAELERALIDGLRKLLTR
jgi:type IV secretory pathway VirJ component